MAKLDGYIYGLTNAKFGRYNPETGQYEIVDDVPVVAVVMPEADGTDEVIFDLSVEKLATFHFTIRFTLSLHDWRHMPILWKRKA